jgi:late competence protein required for DNA uptake (superfamily II DNA/RNA helicase)
MVVPVADFVMVDGSLAWLFYDNNTLAHQMPQASAVHHITVILFLTHHSTLQRNPLNHIRSTRIAAKNGKIAIIIQSSINRRAIC